MKRLIYIFLTVCLLSIYTSSQQLNWKHTGGPMGGIVGDMAINSLGEIYAGVYSFWIDYSGLYKSIDNGESWFKIETQFDDFEVYSIYITKEDHIWVGTNFQGRIYRSTDNGVTWENKRNGYNTGECWAFGQSRDGVMFAGDGQYVRLYRSTDYGDNWELSANLRPLVFATETNNIVYAGTHDGLFATTNNGLTWAQNNFLSNIPVSSILIDSANNIYCGTGYYDNGNGVFYSTDGGQNWTQLGLVGKVVLSLALDTQGNLYAGTKQDGLNKTTDLGQTWVQYKQGIYKKDVFRLKLNIEDDIFIGSEGDGGFSSGGGGIFRSIDNGDYFEHIGLPTSNVKNIVFSGDSLIFASTPSGVQIFNKASKKWSNLGLHDVFGVAISQNGILYAATFAEGLFKSTDLGKSWEITNLTADSIMSTYNVLALSDDTVFVATEFNLRKTTNGGNNWFVLPVKTGFFSRGMLLNNSDIWVTGFGVSNYNFYKSTDGVNFDSTYSGLDWSENNCISGLSNGIIFITDRGFGTYRSTNNGISWQQLLSGRGIWTIYSDESGLVLGGARDTLWYSSNLGESWVPLTTPLKKNSNVTEIKKDNDNQLYLGTYAEGLLELDIITSIEDENNLVINYHLSPNYPNPFNPITKIKYTIPKSERVQIKVYDILGSEIKTLFNDYKQAGTYEIDFDASNLPSGVYFYRIISGSYAETKKMILLR
ncbi:MAG: T9SS type A sorting domain-containing protein [Ignavibacteria bacterium]|nr:T9SS type A sorting domain-containing protein [Ignavibacteria bacterium]